MRGYGRRLRRGLRWWAGESFGECFGDMRLARPPEDLVVAQVAVVRDCLHVAFGGLDELDEIAVVIGETHLCGPPYTPPCGVVRAHKSAENAGGVGPKFLEALKKKMLEILAAGFRFLLGRAHTRGSVG
jgi:hypothetical protein